MDNNMEIWRIVCQHLRTFLSISETKYIVFFIQFILSIESLGMGRYGMGGYGPAADAYRGAYDGSYEGSYEGSYDAARVTALE